MPIINDQEFGEIIVRPHHNATRIALGVAPDGRLKISTPKYTPLITIKVLLRTSRSEIRQLLANHRDDRLYTNSQPIGKSHTLVIQHNSDSSNIKVAGTKIIVSVSPDADLTDVSLQQDIRQSIIKALRKEAKSYLPRRLKFMAEEHSFKYDTVKLTHTSSRWGSCSTKGTISLNIALMQLPFELIDYVLAHELCHTRQMNHSTKFWQEVNTIDPNYKIHRQQLKKYSPNI